MKTWIATITFTDNCTYSDDEYVAINAPDEAAARGQLLAVLAEAMRTSIHGEAQVGHIAFGASQILTESAWLALCADESARELLTAADLDVRVEELATWLAGRTLSAPPAPPAVHPIQGHEDDYYRCGCCGLELLGEECTGFQTRATYANGPHAGCPECGAMNPAPETYLEEL